MNILADILREAERKALSLRPSSRLLRERREVEVSVRVTPEEWVELSKKFAHPFAEVDALIARDRAFIKFAHGVVRVIADEPSSCSSSRDGVPTRKEDPK